MLVYVFTDEPILAWFPVGLGLLALLPAAALVMRTVDHAGELVALCRAGFVHLDPADHVTIYRVARVQEFREHFERVRGEGLTGMSRTYTVVARSGMKLVVDERIDGFMDLAERIGRMVAEDQAPAARATLADGRPVWVGTVRVSLEGIRMAGHDVAWTDVKEFLDDLDHEEVRLWAYTEPRWTKVARDELTCVPLVDEQLEAARRWARED